MKIKGPVTGVELAEGGKNEGKTFDELVQDKGYVDFVIQERKRQK